MRHFCPSSSRYLCTTTACSPGEKGRKGRKSEILPVIGDYLIVRTSFFFEFRPGREYKETYVELREEVLFEFLG